MPGLDGGRELVRDRADRPLGFRRPTLKVFRGSTVLARLVSSGELRTIISGGLWNSTAAITSVQIRPTIGPNFVAGSRVAVYGYRGAVPFV